MKKAVILAAGWGTRLKPLTFIRPKPALRVLDKTLIEHSMEQLLGLVDEVVVVIGYRGEVIKNKIGNNFQGMPVKYVEQKEQLGTGHAALAALPLLDDQFIVLNGDDIYNKEDIKKAMLKNPSILLKELDDPRGYGQVVTEGDMVNKMVEKPASPVSNLVNIGCYHLNKDFFISQIEKSSRGEYEIVDYITNYLKDNPLYFSIAKEWHPVSYPWNLLEAAKEMFGDRKEKREGVVESGVSINGKAILEEGSVIKSGTYIEGPVYVGKNTVVGPNAHLRKYSVVHDECRIGAGVEVKESIIFSNTKIPHLSYIGDSVIGEGCNIGGGTVIANLLFNNKSVRVVSKGEEVDTRRRKMGAIIGDGVKIGVNCSVMPGTVIENDAVIYPHLCVKGNIEKGSKIKN